MEAELITDEMDDDEDDAVEWADLMFVLIIGLIVLELLFFGLDCKLNVLPRLQLVFKSV